MSNRPQDNTSVRPGPAPPGQGDGALLRKATWFNDARTAAVLMIDDLTYGYLDADGRGPYAPNDWGYLARRPGSIFRYFEEQILDRFPEVRYTAFVVFGRHSMAMVDGQHDRYAGAAFESPEFLGLLEHIASSGNEVAYHGHHHGRTDASLDPWTRGVEHEQFGSEAYREVVAEDMRRLKALTGIEMRGGRSPRNQYDPWVLKMMSELGMRWWGRPAAAWRPEWQYEHGLLMFPTSVSGWYLSPRPGGVIGKALQWARGARTEGRLLRMIRRGEVVSIAEHFLRSRPDGRRQAPAIYDDVESLHRFFAILRQHDVWYATCSEIAHYRESHDHTRLLASNEQAVEVKYDGRWSRPFLSFVSAAPRLRRRSDGQLVYGAHKQGRWVYNDLQEGIYEGV